MILQKITINSANICQKQNKVIHLKIRYLIVIYGGYLAFSDELNFCTDELPVLTNLVSFFSQIWLAPGQKKTAF